MMRRRTRWAAPFVVVVAGCGHPSNSPATPGSGTDLVRSPAADAAPAVVSTIVDAAPADASMTSDAASGVVDCNDPRGPTCNPPSPRVREARVEEALRHGDRRCFRAVGTGTSDGVKKSDRGDFVVDGRVVEASGFYVEIVAARMIIGCLEKPRDELPSKTVRMRRTD